MRSFHRWLIWSSLLLVFIFSSPAQAASTVPPRDRILILVSLDGFRWDYLQKFNPPNLTRLAAEGVRAERLIPAFPSLTFPNHYTIVTGLWPEHHGIVGNGFYDPVRKTNYNAFNSSSQASFWWGGEPIWATAIKQGRVADCMFWPGSTVEIGGIRPTKWKPFDKNLIRPIAWTLRSAGLRKRTKNPASARFTFIRPTRRGITTVQIHPKWSQPSNKWTMRLADLWMEFIASIWTMLLTSSLFPTTA